MGAARLHSVSWGGACQQKVTLSLGFEYSLRTSPKMRKGRAMRNLPTNGPPRFYPNDTTEKRGEVSGSYLVLGDSVGTR
jgi:hypothetical protein